MKKFRDFITHRGVNFLIKYVASKEYRESISIVLILGVAASEELAKQK